VEQIDQLKAMRDAAKARLEAMPDFRLMNSLTALIEDLEIAFGMKPAAAVEPAAEPTLEAVAQAPAVEAVEPGNGSAPVEEPAQEVVAAAAVEAIAPEPVEAPADIPAVSENGSVVDLVEEELLMALDGASDAPAETAVETLRPETEEEAVSRALDELSADLADVGLPSEQTGSVMNFRTN
jgi:hypothetical protein